jgi:glycosyltransferase involved in cell wall biosynthesis
MRSVIFAADILVHPARWDAFAPGPLNAISLGTAVIASSSCGSGPALIDHGKSGLLYDAEDVETLAQLLETMIVSRSKRDLFAKAAKENYDSFYKKSPASALLDAIR